MRLVGALLGSQDWSPLHKGSFCTKIIGCSRAIAAVRARVRAYRSGGARGAAKKGPWSEPSKAMRLLPFTEPQRTPINEIPGKWAAIDVVGVEELDERKVGPGELRPRTSTYTPYTPLHPLHFLTPLTRRTSPCTPYILHPLTP